MQTIKFGFSILRIKEVHCFGDSFDIEVAESIPKQISISHKKYNSKESRKNFKPDSEREIDQTLVLHSINKSKFSKKERTFILK